MVFVVTSSNIYSKAQQKLIRTSTLIGLALYLRKQTKPSIIYTFVFFVCIRKPCVIKRPLLLLFIVLCVLFIMASGRGCYI